MRACWRPASCEVIVARWRAASCEVIGAQAVLAKGPFVALPESKFIGIPRCIVAAAFAVCAFGGSEALLSLPRDEFRDGACLAERERALELIAPLLRPRVPGRAMCFPLGRRPLRRGHRVRWHAVSRLAPQ